MTKQIAAQPKFGWERSTEREIRNIPLERIHVPIEYERKDSPREDEALTNSIKRAGVEQPVHVIPEGDDYTLVKGTRRVAISYLCRYPAIPAIIEPPAPEGEDPVAYRNRLRFHLSIRQDLTPSQQCDFILQTMKEYNMNQKEIANYLGCDAGTITNKLAIRSYIAPIREAIDKGEITPFHGRSFDGLSEAGQKTVWKTVRNQLPDLSGHQAHRLVRKKFSPQRFPDYYVSAEKTIAKLARKQKPRRSRKRPKLTKSEKDMLANDLDLKETELRDLQTEIRELKRINIITGPIVQAILRNEAIVSMLPADMVPELHRFSEVY